MKKTYEYRIYPNDEQKVLLSKHFGHCRWMYNYALSRKISHYDCIRAESPRSLAVG